MARKFRNGQKPIENYEVYHGYDIDVNTWFIEVQIPELGEGSILKWFQTEKAYNKGLKKLLWTLYTLP